MNSTGSGFHDGPLTVSRSRCMISRPQMIQAHGSYVGAEGSSSVSAAIAKHATTGHQIPVRGTVGTSTRGRGSRNIAAQRTGRPDGPTLSGQAMDHLELTILGLLVAIAGLSILARKIHVPYPIALVVGGLAVGFVPGVGAISLDPDLVLLIFLPPLLYGAAFFSNPRELKANVRSIGWLAVGLVFVTTGAVAVIAHELIGLPWSVAFVLGAVVSPTDAVAPAQIIRRFGVPRRVVTVIEGENLTNDWTALTLYRFGITAVVTGSFSWAWAAPKFVLTGIGGIAVGLLVGVGLRWVRRRLDDPPTEITISIFSGFAAYIPAEELGLSGVIAAVTVGLYMGWHSAELTTATTRMQTTGVWSTLVFLINAVLFILVGLQFPGLVRDLEGPTTGELPAVGGRRERGRDRRAPRVRSSSSPTCCHASCRGSTRRTVRRPGGSRWSSAGARCAGPWRWRRRSRSPRRSTAAAPFPNRDLIVFLTYCVILATLVLQGLTLGPLVDTLRLRSDGLDEQEETLARIRMSEAGLAKIDALRDEGAVPNETAERTRAMRDFRRRRFEARLDGDSSIDERSARYQEFMREVIGAERDALVTMRNAGDITDDVRRTVERDLDLEEARLSRAPRGREGGSRAHAGSSASYARRGHGPRAAAARRAARLLELATEHAAAARRLADRPRPRPPARRAALAMDARACGAQPRAGRVLPRRRRPVVLAGGRRAIGSGLAALTLADGATGLALRRG